MLEKVKLALGLTTTAYDDDITDDIAAARAELIRSGVASSKASSDTDPLITKAIKTYCQKEYSEGSEAERFTKAWESQLDNIRKSAGYMVES